MTQSPTRAPLFGLWLIIAGAVGWWAAFSLTMERFHLLENPNSTLSCDISPLVQCSANLESWQGSVLGFPNPILGLTGWVAPIVVGVAILGGVRFPRWFWALFTVGVTLAMVLVVWLIVQSIYVLGTLCPWCMVTWSVTIPTFFAVWFYGFGSGLLPAPPAVKKAGQSLMSWLILFAVVSYVVIAVLAELRLGILARLF